MSNQVVKYIGELAFYMEACKQMLDLEATTASLLPRFIYSDSVKQVVGLESAGQLSPEAWHHFFLVYVVNFSLIFL